MRDWDLKARQEVSVGEFDVIMTNPPFGQKLEVTERTTLAQYDLGSKWRKVKGGDGYEKTDKVADS